MASFFDPPARRSFFDRPEDKPGSLGARVKGESDLYGGSTRLQDLMSAPPSAEGVAGLEGVNARIERGRWERGEEKIVRDTAQTMDALSPKPKKDESFLDGIGRTMREMRLDPGAYARSLPGGVVQGVGSGIRGIGTLAEVVDRQLREKPIEGAHALIDAVLGLDNERTRKGAALIREQSYSPSDATQDLGGAIYDFAENVILPEKSRRTMGTEIVGAVGQISAQLAVGLLTGPAGATGFLAGQGADQMDQRKSGPNGGLLANASQDARDTAVLGGAALTTVLERTGLDQLVSRVPPKIKNAVMRQLADIGMAGGIEAATEVAEGIAHNMVAKALLDEDADITEGMVDDAVTAGGAGAVARLLINAFTGRRAKLGEFRSEPLSREEMAGGLQAIVESPDTSPGERAQASARLRRLEAAQTSVGFIEVANVASDPTPEDEASPLPTDLIAQGKTLLQGAAAKLEADKVLDRNSAPRTGTMVELQGRRWTVEDAFADENGEEGVTLSTDGLREKFYFADLADAGISLAPVADTRERGPHSEPQISAIAEPKPANIDQKGPGPISGAEQLKARIRRVESSGNDAAQNLQSSASGRYQFTDSTFAAYYRKVYGAEPGPGVKNDPEVQERLMDALVKDNEAALKKAGFEATAGNLYLAHFAGVGGALRLLRNPKGSAEALLGKSAADANGNIIRGKTAAEVIAWADRKMLGSGSPTDLGTPRFVDGTAAEPETDDAFDFLNTSLLPEGDVAQVALPPVTEITPPQPVQEVATPEPAAEEPVAVAQPEPEPLAAPIRVYHGGPGTKGDLRVPFYTVAGEAVARTYAEDRGRGAGQVEAFDIQPSRIAEETDIAEAARAVGVPETSISQAPGGMLLDEGYYEQAPRVVEELQRRGFDAARYEESAVDDGAAPGTAFAVLNPTIVQRVDQAPDTPESAPLTVAELATSTEPAAEPTTAPPSDFPILDRSLEPEAMARKVAAELVRSGKAETNGMGEGYKWDSQGIGMILVDGKRPPKGEFAIEVDTGAGRRAFSFPRTDLASTPEASAPAKPTKFDPQSKVDELRAYVANRRNPVGDIGRVAKKLGVTKGQAQRVVGTLAAQRGSGLFMSRKGNLRRLPQRNGPVSLLHFIKDRGGVRAPDRHRLTARGRDIHLRHPGLISGKGMAFDEALEAAVEAGYFGVGNDTGSVTEDDFLQALDEAGSRYRPEDAADVRQRQEREKAGTNAAYARRDRLDDALASDALKPFVPAEISDADKAGILDLMETEADVGMDDPYSAATEYFARQFVDVLDRGATVTNDTDYDIPFDLGAPTDAQPDRDSEDGSAEAAETGDGPARGQGDKGGGSPAGTDSRADGGGVDLLGEPVAAAPARQQAAEPEFENDMFGTRDGDERRALVRAGEGRLKGGKAQKAAGADGGLFDQQAPQTDIEKDALSQARAALQTAMNALDAADGRAPATDAAQDPERPMLSLAGSGEEVFYSALERAILQTPTKRASAAQWAATLGKTPGVKREELEWSGIFDFLDMQEGPIEREALLALVREGGIQVEEVVLGPKRDIGDLYTVHEQRDGWIIISPDGHLQGEYDTEQEARREADDLNGTTGPVQFQDWSSDPSNDTYRELLITLPLGVRGNPKRGASTHWDQEAVVAHARFMEKRDAEGKRVLFIEEVQSDWHQKGRDEGYENAGAVKPAQEAFDAAKTALDEAEAKMIALANELDPSANTNYASRARAILENISAKKTPNWEGLGTAPDEWTPEQLRINERIEAVMGPVRRLGLRFVEVQTALNNASQGIPNAPFKSSWPALVMKRMIRYAVDGGFDRVAWTTGAEQAERYGLEKHIGLVELRRSAMGAGQPPMGPLEDGQRLNFVAYPKSGGSPVVDTYIESRKELEQYLPADIAMRLWEQEPTSAVGGGGWRDAMRSLSGLDLKTGGEGMRAFYDRNLVNITNDLIKKHGGKVERVRIVGSQSGFGDASFILARIADLEEQADQGNEAAEEKIAALKGDLARLGGNPGFTITPSLAEAARGGFPLFNRRNNDTDAAVSADNRRGGLLARREAAAVPDPEALVAEWKPKLQASMKRLGIEDRILLNVVGRIDGAAMAEGSYFRRAVTVALEMARNPLRAFNHEAMHALRALDLFRPAEWTAMVKKAKSQPGLMDDVRRRYASQNLTEDQLEEEAVAETYAPWQTARDAKGFVGKAFQRIADFFRVIGDAFKGEVSAKSVFRNIERGRIGGRETGSGAREPAAPLQSRDDSPAFPEEIESRWQDARKGIGDGPGVLAKMKEAWEAVVIGFTRHWKYLPNETRFADLQQQFRKLEATPEWARNEVVRRLRLVVGKMSRDEYDLFTRTVVLNDLRFEAESGHDLPFGFTPETLAEAREKIDALVNANPKIVEALLLRSTQSRALANEMVAEGVLTREQIKNPAYFRHMVLDYARAERQMARGAGKEVKSPWWAKREGSSKDINANYLEAEADWMLKALVDIQTAKTIRYIKESEHNIRDSLRVTAKERNATAVAKRLATRKNLAAEDAALADTYDAGLEDVRKAIKAGALGVVPAHLDGAAKTLREGTEPDDTVPALLAWILEEGKPGARGASKALKALGQRREWTRNLLGDQYLNPDDVQGLAKRLAPEGYVGWQPREGRHLFTAKTIPEHVLDRFISSLADTGAHGVSKDEMFRALASIKPQLVVGGERYTMVIPKEIADTLDEFGDISADNMVGKLFSLVNGAWKQWALINPRRLIKYNLNNQVGDLDAIIAGSPRALLKVGQAARELFEVMAKDGVPTARYREAMERGVFTSGLSLQEIPDINRLSALKHLNDQKRSLRPDKLTFQAVGAVWRALQGVTNYREAVFRYAAYLDYAERLEAGEPQSKVGYGASIRKIVDGVKDPKDRAALLARDLVGDYGAISVAGGWLRKYLIPFWSWTEINTKRYWRLTGNAFGQSTAKGLVTGGLLGAGIAARTAVTLAVRMAFVYGLITLYNALLFGDEEEELTEQQRRQLHLILGRDEDGKVITLRVQGALSDVIGMLGFPDAVAGIKRAQNGQGTYAQAAASAAKAPINRVGTSVTPIFSVPVEQAMGVELWPDMFEPRPIKDKLRHLFSTFSLENEYDVAADRPSRGYGRSWSEAFVYRRDPGEMAYDEAKNIAYEWMENIKGQSAGGGESPRSGALRDYKMALRYGDTSAAEKALIRYEELGGTDEGLETSIKRAHPLGPIPKKFRQEFLDTLTDEQYEAFLEAEEWYDAVYLGRPVEQPVGTED